MYYAIMQIANGVNTFFRILDLALTLYCLLSFFGRGTRLFAFLYRFFEPLLRPFRGISMYLISRGFPFDVSVICLYLAMEMANSLVTQILYMLVGMW